MKDELFWNVLLKIFRRTHVHAYFRQDYTVLNRNPLSVLHLREHVNVLHNNSQETGNETRIQKGHFCVLNLEALSCWESFFSGIDITLEEKAASKNWCERDFSSGCDAAFDSDTCSALSCSDSTTLHSCPAEEKHKEHGAEAITLPGDRLENE